MCAKTANFDKIQCKLLSCWNNLCAKPVVAVKARSSYALPNPKWLAWDLWLHSFPMFGAKRLPWWPGVQRNREHTFQGDQNSLTVIIHQSYSVQSISCNREKNQENLLCNRTDIIYRHWRWLLSMGLYSPSTSESEILYTWSIRQFSEIEITLSTDPPTSSILWFLKVQQYNLAAH